MKKASILVAVFLSGFILFVQPAKAEPAACKGSGWTNLCTTCPTTCDVDTSSKICTCQSSPKNADNPFGQIINPINKGSLGPNGGLITLLNNILRLIYAAAGIFAFVRILLAGFGFISAGGDAKKIESAWASIWQSLMGLVIIVSSIALAALVGLVLFGDAAAILNPKVYGPGF